MRESEKTGEPLKTSFTTLRWVPKGTWFRSIRARFDRQAAMRSAGRVSVESVNVASQQSKRLNSGLSLHPRPESLGKNGALATSVSVVVHGSNAPVKTLENIGMLAA